MRHFVLVGDSEDVFGVWEAPDATAADRLRMKLKLKYPGCRTEVRQATDFETFKRDTGDIDVSELELEVA